MHPDVASAALATVALAAAAAAAATTTIAAATTLAFTAATDAASRPPSSALAFATATHLLNPPLMSRSSRAPHPARRAGAAQGDP